MLLTLNQPAHKQQSLALSKESHALDWTQTQPLDIGTSNAYSLDSWLPRENKYCVYIRKSSPKSRPNEIRCTEGAALITLYPSYICLNFENFGINKSWSRDRGRCECSLFWSGQNSGNDLHLQPLGKQQKHLLLLNRPSQK